MTAVNYNTLSLDELRRYMLTHRDDIQAFQVYIDRSKAAGRMITIDPSNPNWEDDISDRVQQHLLGNDSPPADSVS
jgi:hypothetical protein